MSKWSTVPMQIGRRAIICTAIVMHVVLHSPRVSTAELPTLNDAVTTPDVLVGKLVDVRGQPLVGATVSANDRRRYGIADPAQTKSDDAGRFQLESPGAFDAGRITSVCVDTKTGLHYEVNLRVTPGVVEVRVPTLIDVPSIGPSDVKPDELVGVVVDDAGKPIANV